MKGQSTIEFLGAAFLFLIALIGSLTMMSGQVPQFRDDVQQSAHNMEIYRLTENMITKPGWHTYGSGGSNWEKNASTISGTTQLGLAADYHVIAWDKLQALSTTGRDRFNYSQFRDINELDNQYYFNFTWYPIVETSKTFTRGSSPSYIDEPTDDDSDGSRYYNAENRVHYGTFRLNGSEFPFLVAAFDGVYNTVYVTGNPGDWNFYESSEHKVGDVISLDGTEFRVKKIQNRERRPGAAVILSRHLKSFGAPPETADSTTVKLNRYVSLRAPETDKEVVRMGVLSW
ncbi:MAG: hypothetical protein ABEK16_00715 [Candidatus Nanohalobium sp.]